MKIQESLQYNAIQSVMTRHVIPVIYVQRYLLPVLLQSSGSQQRETHIRPHLSSVITISES